MGRPTPGALASLVLAAACWGLGTVIAKRAVGEVPPFTLLLIQLGSSVAVLAVVMRLGGIPLTDPSAPPLLGRLGLLNPGAAYAMSLLGLTSITASLSVLLWALEPLLIVLLAVVVLRERVGPVVVVLSAIAIAGLVVVAQPAMTATMLGVALTVAGVVACAIYTIVVRSYLARPEWSGASESTAQVILVQQAYAFGLTLAMVVVLAVGGRGPGLASVTPVGLASAVGSGLLYYAAAYWFYLTGLRAVPASIASASFYLVPVFGVAGGFALLGESLSAGQWLGVVIAATAVVGILGRTLSASQLRPARSAEVA